MKGTCQDKIENISKPASVPFVKYDVVGPICESTDCFGKEVELPETFRNDLISLRSTAAYGEVMASHYNLRDEIRGVYSSEG